MPPKPAPSSYRDRLHDVRWLKKKISILERDKHTCLFCDSNGEGSNQLHVRFITREDFDPWDYPDDVYQTICDDCLRKRQPMIDDGLNNIRLAIATIPTEQLDWLFQQLVTRCQVVSKNGKGESA